ncbi:hypothetical protein K7B10_01840 [Streptomyces flavotricini]|uniref:Uncharacterized protein n=1 Tax=Streptomyces flavotricini TaxID=66888 RepID=A0ABS8DZT8_9ACTN|nr:hypothetical protein [Streptomyces flavotricini]MCC0093554.1 hypothetical protein [Streptomyces flavotricini]
MRHRDLVVIGAGSGNAVVDAELRAVRWRAARDRVFGRLDAEPALTGAAENALLDLGL